MTTIHDKEPLRSVLETLDVPVLWSGMQVAVDRLQATSDSHMYFTIFFTTLMAAMFGALLVDEVLARKRGQAAHGRRIVRRLAMALVAGLLVLIQFVPEPYESERSRAAVLTMEHFIPLDRDHVRVVPVRDIRRITIRDDGAVVVFFGQGSTRIDGDTTELLSALAAVVPDVVESARLERRMATLH